MLALLTAIALALRVWGTGFGLPFLYHPDEYQYVETALDAAGGDWNPDRLNNPTLFKYALAVEYAAVYQAGRLAGAFPPMPQFKDTWQAGPALFYFVGRLSVAALGALTVLALYALGRRAYGRRVGLLAAAFLAFSFIHARESHFAVNDVPATLLAVVALLLALRLLERPDLATFAAAGLAAGLAASTKYTAGLVAVSLAIATLLVLAVRRGRVPLLPVSGGVAAALAGFVVGTPYVVLDRQMFVHDLQALVQDGSQGYKGLILDPDGGWLFYLKTLDWGLGTALFALSIAGLAYALLRHRRQDVVLAAFPLVLYLFMGRQLMFFGRFILPAVPVLLLFAARLLSDAAGRLPWPDSRRRLVLGVVTAAVLVQPVFADVRFDDLLTRTDSRTLARDWIRSNVPDGARLAVEPYGPQLGSAPYQVDMADNDGLSDHNRTLAYYRDEGYDYLVVSSFIYDRTLQSDKKQQTRQAFYASLGSEAELVQEIKPYSGAAPPYLFDQVYGPAVGLAQLQRPGPTIRIYRISR